MSSAITLTWGEVAAIVGIFTPILIVGIAAMKTIFMTKPEHEDICTKVQAPVCQKIDSLQLQIKEMERRREEARVHRTAVDLWLAQSLRKIADKVGADISDMPTERS